MAPAVQLNEEIVGAWPADNILPQIAGDFFSGRIPVSYFPLPVNTTDPVADILKNFLTEIQDFHFFHDAAARRLGAVCNPEVSCHLISLLRKDSCTRCHGGLSGPVHSLRPAVPFRLVGHYLKGIAGDLPAIDLQHNLARPRLPPA